MRGLYMDLSVVIWPWKFGFYWNVFKIVEDMPMKNILSVIIMFQDNTEAQIQSHTDLFFFWKDTKFN